MSRMAALLGDAVRTIVEPSPTPRNVVLLVAEFIGGHHEPLDDYTNETGEYKEVP